ncbi:MAG: enoyl-CoA hydratase [Bacteroidota bacterium]
MSDSSSEHVHSVQNGTVLHITLSRIEKKNALTRAMYDALADALAEAAASAETCVVVLSGRDRVFTAGNDLMDFMAAPPTGPDSPVFRFLTALVGFPKPLLVAVDGPAIGIGTTLLLHADLAYATPETRFQMPFVPLGLVPEAASSLLLPRLAGHARAAELLMFGEPFSADTAREIGLVNEIVDSDAVVSRALERARQLAALPPSAVRQTKAFLRRPLAEAVAETISQEGAAFMERLTSPEAQEAFTAFFEKRPPDFSRFE